MALRERALAPEQALRRPPLPRPEAPLSISARTSLLLAACSRNRWATVRCLAKRLLLKTSTRASAVHASQPCLLACSQSAGKPAASRIRAPHPPAMPKVDSRRFCAGAAPPVSVANTGVFFGVAFGRGIAAGPADVTSPPGWPSAMLPEPYSTAMTVESCTERAAV